MSIESANPSLRLLIVEDEALIADELEHRLRRRGHEVVAVSDTADAAEAAAALHRPDLVLMDIRLKGPRDGIEAAEAIYAEHGIPVIYLTAHSDRPTTTRATSGAGVFGYLIKPVDEHELLIAMDVAMQRHRRSLAMHDSVLSCETVVREMADGVITTDELGCVRAMNRTAEVLCGCHAEAAQGQPLAQVLPLADLTGQPCIEPLITQLVRGIRVELREATLQRAERLPREVWVTCSPVRERVRVIGAVLVVRDVTDRRTALEAQRASRAKTEFLSRMSHEVRTPLNAVLGFTELLVSDTLEALTDRQRQRLTLVMDAARHLRALIDDVMDVSLIEAGQLPVNLGRVELEPALDGAVQLCADLARRHGVRIEPLYRDTVAPALADPVRLRQVLVNVLSNAIKYNRRGGVVRVSLESVTGAWHVHVSDDGLGMTGQQLEHLFEPFNRLGREQGPIAGTGLGMSLTRQLARAMGGEVEVHSRERSGTQVTLTLRRTEQAPSPGAARIDSQAPVAALAGVVVYIEDNLVNSTLVEAYLSRWPRLRLHIADTGTAGLAAVRRLRPDLLLLDMQLPDMNGLQVLEQLRQDEAMRAMPVLALSASAMPGEVRAALAGGALEYLTKPLDLPAFERELRRHLSRNI